MASQSVTTSASWDEWQTTAEYHDSRVWSRGRMPEILTSASAGYGYGGRLVRVDAWSWIYHDPEETSATSSGAVSWLNWIISLA